MNTKAIHAIVPAAGIGTRMQSDVPKQYMMLNGKPLIEHTLSCLLSHPLIDNVAVALHPNDKHFADLAVAQDPRITTVTGANHRSDTVLKALRTLPDNVWALVHDAARPCVTHADITKLIACCDGDTDRGAILASPVRDTMKRGNNMLVEKTVDRSDLWHALTPQFFHADTLVKAYEYSGMCLMPVTDEASAMEQAGCSVSLVHGHPGNIKVTYPEDLALAAYYLRHNATQLENAACE